MQYTTTSNIIIVPLGFYLSNNNYITSTSSKPYFDTSGFSLFDNANSVYYNIRKSGSTDVISFSGTKTDSTTLDVLFITNLLLNCNFSMFGGTVAMALLMTVTGGNTINGTLGTITYTNTGLTTTSSVNSDSVSYLSNDNKFNSNIIPYFTTNGYAFQDTTNVVKYNIHKSSSGSGLLDVISYTGDLSTSFTSEALGTYTVEYAGGFSGFSGSVSFSFTLTITNNTIVGISGSMTYTLTFVNSTSFSILPVNTYVNNDNLIVSYTTPFLFNANGFGFKDNTNNINYNIFNAGSGDYIVNNYNNSAYQLSMETLLFTDVTYNTLFSDLDGTVAFALTLAVSNPSHVITAVSGTITYSNTYTTTTNISILSTGNYLSNNNLFSSIVKPYFDTSGLAFIDNTNNIKYNVKRPVGTDLVYNNGNRTSSLSYEIATVSYMTYIANLTYLDYSSTPPTDTTISFNLIFTLTSAGAIINITGVSGKITYSSSLYQTSTNVSLLGPTNINSIINDNRFNSLNKPYFTTNGVAFKDNTNNISYNINSSTLLNTTQLDIIVDTIGLTNLFSYENIQFNIVPYSVYISEFSGTVQMSLLFTLIGSVISNLSGTITYSSGTGLTTTTNITLLPLSSYLSNNNLLAAIVVPFFDANGLSFVDNTNNIYYNIHKSGSLDVVSFNRNTVISTDSFISETLSPSTNFALSNGNSTQNTDIVYYIPSASGSYVVNTTMEKALLDIINNATPNFAWVKELGHRIMKSVQLTIGGQPIEVEYTPELFHFLHLLKADMNQIRGYNIMIGNTEEMYTVNTLQRSITRLYIPLRYWFNKHFGNGIPLINMMNSEMILNITINDLSNLLYTDSGTIFSKEPKLGCKLLVGYVYIDEDERMKMADKKLEYLIEKMNYNGELYFSHNDLIATSGMTDATNYNSISLSQVNPTFNVKLRIQDPTKYIIWYLIFEDLTTVQPVDVLDWNKFGYNVRNSSGTMVSYSDIVSSMTIYFGGTVREQAKHENFYKYVVPHKSGCSSLSDGMYMYSFALYPLMIQPSGSANFSELDDCSIDIVFNPTITQLLIDNPNLRARMGLYGCAYNILRVMSGCTGLAFFS
jgi:hypothetical protein